MKKMRIAALAGLAAVFAVGGSLAYFNQNLEAVNVLTIGAYNTTVTENFRPEDGKDWAPGSTVKKEVYVENTGDIPVVARIWFTETWTRREGDSEVVLNTVSSRKTDKENKPLPGSSPEKNPFITQKQEKLEDGSPDGETEGDWTVVEKVLNLGDDWFYNPADGCYYYTKILDKETNPKTGVPLLESVTLSEDVDMGRIQEVKYYSTEENPTDDTGENGDWIKFSPDSQGNPVSETDLPDDITAQIKHFRSDLTVDGDKKGYSSAKYTLSVMGQTVQATKSAVAAEFGESVVELASEKGWEWNYLSETLTNQ